MTIPKWNDKNRPVNEQGLSLAKIQMQDVVNPTVINNNFDRVEERLSLDYIASAGSTGYWWWRQFNSGFTLFGIDDFPIGNVPVNVEWDGAISSATLTIPGELPFQFATIPYFDISLQSYDVTNTNMENWRFFMISQEPFKRNSRYPPAFCIYWWPGGNEKNKKPTLKDVTISCFGYAFLN